MKKGNKFSKYENSFSSYREAIKKINKIENKNVEEYKFARPLSEATLRNLNGYMRYSDGHGTYVIKKWRKL